MNKWNYIDLIAKASDKNGNLLVELMDMYNARNTQDITEEQAKDFYERKVKN